MMGGGRLKPTTTLSKNEDGTFNLLIQDGKGRVVLFVRSITFREAVYEIEMRMYTKEGDDGN